MKTCNLLTSLTVGALLTVLSTLQAQPVFWDGITNTTSGGSDHLTFSSDTNVAASFYVEDTAFTITSISLRLSGAFIDSGNPGQMSVAIYDQNSGHPGTLVANFSPQTFASAGVYTFTGSAPVNSLTYYYVVASATGASSYNVDYWTNGYVGSSGITGGPANGGGQWTGTTGSGWTVVNPQRGIAYGLNGGAIPEPSTYAALVGALALGVAAYSRRRHLVAS